MTPHGPTDATHRGPQDRLASIPERVWVRHGGQTHELSVFCPDTAPYSTTVIMRAMYGRAGEEAGPHRVVAMPEGRAVTIAGCGLSSDDPLYCAELQDDPLPQCQCGYHHPTNDDDVAETFADQVSQDAATDAEHAWSMEVGPSIPSVSTGEQAEERLSGGELKWDRSVR